MRLSHLELPFFEEGHRALALELDTWSAQQLQGIEHNDTDNACRSLVRQLVAAGFMRHCVPPAYAGASAQLESRALVVCRETLARHDGMADFSIGA